MAETLGAETAPLRRRGKPTLGQIVAYYKYQTTKIINQIDHTPKHRVWQCNYYDRIIRHPNTFHLIQQYIIANPIRWSQDPINPRRGAVSALNLRALGLLDCDFCDRNKLRLSINIFTSGLISTIA